MNNHTGAANRNARLSILAGLVLACLFYVMGPFGVANVFGIRREVQVAAVGLLTFVLIMRSGFDNINWKRPVIWLLIAWVLILVRAENVTALRWLECGITLLAVCVIESHLGPEKRTIVKSLVAAAFLFAVLGWLQMAYLMISHEATGIQGGYTSGDMDKRIDILHPAMYFGFFDTLRDTRIFAVWVPRMYSYASEPSLLVPYLLVPGILGILLGGKWRGMGYITVAFCLIPAQTGTAWLGVLIGVVIWLELFLLRKLRRVTVLSILIAVVVVVIGGAAMDVVSTSYMLFDNTARFSEVSTELSNKAESGVDRLASIQTGISLVIQNPFGTRGEYQTVSAPFITEFGVTLGLFGMLAAIILIGIVAVINLLVGIAATKKDTIQMLSCCTLAGLCVVVLVFQGYGWNGCSGFILLSLLSSSNEWAVSSNREEAARYQAFLHTSGIRGRFS